MKEEVLLLVGCYLIGSIPFGLLFSRLKGVDPRKEGSGNIGATNVARTAGKTLGVLTLLADGAKGAVPVLLASNAFGREWASLCGLCCFLGHLFPPYLRFRGGKGVATAFGVFLALTPLGALLAAAIFILGVAFSRVVSIGSMAGALLLPFYVYFREGENPLFWTSLIVSLLILLRHKANIQRLLKGTEHRISL